ncbi:hypothetical protein [uncultured Erythrobacter sp.]|uniref:hypothetical protein n=1 Tax=uncultured Erythrobacter sp. TaxID=263913 RepID=UPI0026240FF1|nr:hypothetical protein [uncultured Erythrobacter sp.]
MTLEDFYFISQIAAALGIMLSLIFVGLQIRQNTVQSKAEAAEASHRAMIEWYYHQSPENAAIMAKVAQPDTELTDAERYSFFAISMPLLMNMQEAHAKWVDGSLDDSRWEFWDAYANVLTFRSLADEIWEHRKALFTPRFRDYFQGKLDARDPSDVTGTWQTPHSPSEPLRAKSEGRKS